MFIIPATLMLPSKYDYNDNNRKRRLEEIRKLYLLTETQIYLPIK